MMVFGSYQEINDISQQIKSDIDGVLKSIRPLGPSQFYSLNQPARGETHSMPDNETLERHKTATAMFPTHGRDNQVLSDEQIEKRALQQHLREQVESKHLYPSASDAQAEIDAELNPQRQAGKTLLTENID